MKQIFILSVCVCILYTNETQAQEKTDSSQAVKISAQIRVREETDRRDLNRETGYDNYTFFRTRFGVLMTPVKNYSGFIQFQDSRVYGKEKSPTDDSKNVDLHQAYILARHFIWNRMDVKLGRMEISYGEERLLGKSNWGNTGRSFDGSLFMFSLSEALKLDVFTFRLNENSPPPTVADTTTVPENEDRDFIGLYMMYSHSDKFKADFYLIGDIDRTKNSATNNKDSLNRATFGTFVRGGLGDFSYKSDAAIQTGETNGKTISAFLLTGSIGYTFSQSDWKPSVWIGSDYVSGDDDPSDDKIKTFNTLYGSSRYYGGMDYFTDMAKHTGQLGLQDNMIKFKIKPVKNLSVGMDYHYFLSARKNKALNSKVFGHEVDLVASYKVNPFVSFESGFSVMFPGKLLKNRFGNHGDTGTWGYFTTLFEF